MCYNAGWTNADKLLLAVSICLAESNGYTHARHTNPDGSIDRGLWQINDQAHSDITDADADDPIKATAWARKIYEGRSEGFSSWAAYTNGAYKGPRAMGYALDGVRNYLAEKHGFPVPH